MAEPAPRYVALFCDFCGDEVRGDFLVRSKQEGLTAIRRWARDKLGWQVEASDVCPRCLAAPASVLSGQPETDR